MKNKKPDGYLTKNIRIKIILSFAIYKQHNQILRHIIQKPILPLLSDENEKYCQSQYQQRNLIDLQHLISKQKSNFQDQGIFHTHLKKIGEYILFLPSHHTNNKNVLFCFNIFGV